MNEISTRLSYPKTETAVQSCVVPIGCADSVLFVDNKYVG